MDLFFKTNKALWDQWTHLNLKSPMYDMETWKTGRNSLDAISLNALQGEIDGRKILHLMCHFGQDTLSMARMGATVTGIDISSEAIKTARTLAEDIGLADRAEFIETNIYDLPDHLDETFDLVYTSFGVLAWLSDLQEWAKIINRYLRPGGTFFIAEFHPFLYAFDFDQKQLDFEYFGDGVPIRQVEKGNYSQRENEKEFEFYFWIHSLSQTLRPLLDQGFQLIDFNEYNFSPYNCFPNMEEREVGKYVFQAPGKIQHIPHVFSLKMKK
ncbi:MAG: class I SAM-dependent methyltransferase [Saprospiraceae bacterium]|nr:class I SAM-dependent methyltransferase [Saprospiraceae bacterium]